MVVTDITTAQIATLINASIIIVQSTLALALVVLLVYAMRNVNPAISWSAITRRLHSSPWPTLLRTDSATSGINGAAVWLISTLTIVGAILLAAAGVVTPLGLKDGPIVFSQYTLMDASYIQDSSPIGLATPSRNMYTRGRICGEAIRPIACPGNGDTRNTSVIAPSTINTFSSTSKGPFNMQYRRYTPGQPGPLGYGRHPTMAVFVGLQSLILRSDIFAIEGLIVDMTENPGIGLWNHTFPSLEKGGTWNQDVLWLEPVASCVNMNVSLDYNLKVGNFSSTTQPSNFTDRGGIANLIPEGPPEDSGQHINLRARAYKGAVLSQAEILRGWNITRNQSYIGRTFGVEGFTDIEPGKVNFVPVLTSNTDTQTFIRTDVACNGYDFGTNTPNITIPGIHCYAFIGPPERIDGGDQQMTEENSSWTQSIHYCAAATRARIQTITFSFNGTRELSDLHISRRNTGSDVLWAMEKADIRISDIDPFWGHVADSYENDPTLSTVRSETFYIPAGSSDLRGAGLSSKLTSQPSSVSGMAWSVISGHDALKAVDYLSVGNDNALSHKWHLVMQDDAANGASRISNGLWTDLVANNLVGTDTNTKLLAGRQHGTVVYDYRYAIPAFLLLGLWVPAFLGAILVLACGRVKLSHLRYLLNQTSVGRIVTGDSALVTISHPGEDPSRGGDALSDSAGYMHVAPGETSKAKTSRLPTSTWAETVGQTLVGLAAAEESCPVVPDSHDESTNSLHGDTSTGEAGSHARSSDSDIRRRRLRKVLGKVVSDGQSVSGSPQENSADRRE